MNNSKSKDRTPQDKLSRHVTFGLENSKNLKTENTLPPEVLAILANWLKNLRHINTLPLDNKEWVEGLCKSCMHVESIESTPDLWRLLRNTREYIFKSWPRFSGAKIFPIPGGWQAFQEPTPEYIALRKELSLHCIAELEKLLIPQYFSVNLSLENRIKVLKLLKKLYRLPTENEKWETGLCYHISAIEKMPVARSTDYSAHHFKTWKYFSGLSRAPIPIEADINKTKSRKQLRKNLCGHVIKSIQAELKYVL